MKKIAFTLLLTLIAYTAEAQEEFTGKIDNWNNGSGEVVTGMMEPTVIGSIDDQGNFKIPLEPNFLDDVKKQIEEENKNSNGWTTSLKTLDNLARCNEDDSIIVVNGAQPISNLSVMGMFQMVNMEAKKRLGVFFAANSKEFVEPLMDLGSYSFKKGYYIDWYFVDEPGSVKGTCSVDAYALNQEEIYTKTNVYDLDFKKGWNIVKYEYKELFTDKEGHTYPAEIIYSTVDEIPNDITMVYIEDEG